MGSCAARWRACFARRRIRSRSSSGRRSTRRSNPRPTAARTSPTSSRASSSRTAEPIMVTIVAIIVIALAFDYINGFHDAANSIATVVSTRVLTPRQAVVWAAFFNFIAFVVFPLHVAHTIGKGIIDPKIIDDAVLFGALGGAIAWNLITWFYGLPSSSSHALVGGLIGAGFCKGGSSVIQSGVLKTALFIVISPVLGMLLGGGIMVMLAWIFRRKQPGKIDRWFRRLQLVS